MEPQKLSFGDGCQAAAYPVGATGAIADGRTMDAVPQSIGALQVAYHSSDAQLTIVKIVIL
jgi:hypothetical protein